MKTPSIRTLAATLAAASLLTAAAAAEEDYTLHEWGTFTNVIGSDGTHLDGVHREDAPLPKFVYELDAPPQPSNRPQRTKGLDYSRSFAHVNVRLETPVIYFYTDHPFDAQVDVGFENGTIGQWYPNRSAGEQRQLQALLDFAKPRTGSIRWDVRVEPAGEDQSSRVFRAGELPCWLYPRYPDSALVTNAKGETEKYLFYRGLGRMELPVVFSATDQELHITNRGEDEIANLLVFDHNGKDGARWWKPGPLAARIGKVTVPLDNTMYLARWQQALYADGLKMLMDAGLYRKEADAMMQTWWSSYFETQGLRVFWIVPRAKVDELLPLKVSPAPKNVERVIVGRSEILTPSFEKRLVSDFAAAAGKEQDNRWASDRFFPAYSARVKQLNDASPPIAAPAPGQSQAALEVHEWGTFTVLQGSDGQVIEWYQAPDKLVDLPSFVRRSLSVAGKTGSSRWSGSGRMDVVRMETPVLYFYPEEKMDVAVSASFPMGRITEVFPPAITSPAGETIWKGTLLPPDSPERSKVPAATGAKGRHYAAARDVPEAWLFRSHPRPAPRTSAEAARRAMSQAAKASTPTKPPAPKIEPIDHFIFYRGAGNRGGFEISAVQGEGSDTFTLTNTGGAVIPKLLALRVNEGQTSWLTLDALAPIEFVEGKPRHQQTFTFSAPVGPAEKVAADLKAVMIETLHSEGLTEAEAAAMVATWDDLWFTDPGTRILAVLPQSFADEMVPLKITPAPAKLDRVFVARVELITREQEQVLTSLLEVNTSGADATNADRERLEALKLGRYAAGGLERATTLVARAMHNRFAALTRPRVKVASQEDPGDRAVAQRTAATKPVSAPK